MNTIKNLFATFFVLLSVALVAQDNGEKIFIDFGDEKITKAEFKRVYEKNNNGEMVSKSTVDEYLELYINFKLKVLEAEARGLDTNAGFVKELAGYRRQLAQPYMSADNILEELKKEAYERLQEDIRASHILISVKEDASPEDTLLAYKKAEEVKKKLEKGEDFEALAKEYSDDPSAKVNGGDLGYFTAFYMVYPFESAAYNTKEGEISEIVRSKFGYHILKITDRREAVGNITVEHILISNNPEISKTDNPEGKIKEIYGKIKGGAPFVDMAAQFSDDTRSASNGGRLPTFGVSRMVPEFEAVAYSLKKPGDISKPFETQYGWHIIKLIQKQPIGSYDEIESELTSRVEKDSRSNLEEGAVLRKIQKDYGFTENLSERNDFYEALNESYFEDGWDPNSISNLNKTLFTIGDKKVNQTDFAKFLAINQTKRNPMDIQVLVNRKYNDFKSIELVAFKDSKLDEEYPEFKALMQEYHDGILLFNLTDKVVWSKAVKDSAGLQNFYENNKEKYKWGKRVDAIVFSALNEKVANSTKELIKEADSVDASAIADKINSTSLLNLKYELNKYEKGINETVDAVEWVEGVSENKPKDGRVEFVYIKEVLKPSYKTIEDSRGIITSDYQEYLEKEWIKSLREKYSFTIDQAILKNLKNELN
ncbi:MAG: peptidyl-prolyl cis-trans isomerase [Vicingaceae bacterium]